MSPDINDSLLQEFEGISLVDARSVVAEFEEYFCWWLIDAVDFTGDDDSSINECLTWLFANTSPVTRAELLVEFVNSDICLYERTCAYFNLEDDEEE